jgi:hypothetical protein
VCVLPGRRTHRLAERCERWLGDATCTWRVQRRCDSAAVVVALPLHAADGIVHVRGSPASLSIRPSTIPTRQRRLLAAKDELLAHPTDWSIVVRWARAGERW